MSHKNGNTYFKLAGEEQLDKSSPLVAEIKKWVDEQYEDGRVTVMTDQELLQKISELRENERK